MGKKQALEILRGALRDWPGALDFTRWPRGVKSTYGHSERRPATGVTVRQTLREHYAWLVRYAATIHEKGTGIVLGYAVSRTGGSTNDEIEAITALVGDCDGGGDWDAIQGVLLEVGMAAIVQRSGGDTPEHRKWHLHVPLAEPLKRRAGETTQEWARRERSAYAFVLGFLAELGGLAARQSDPPHVCDAGFDASIANRLCQPCYPGCKRKVDAPVPETRLYEGRALDMDALLALAGYREPSPGPCLEVAADPNFTTAWLNSLALAGMLGREISPGKYIARCPNASAHSADRNSDGTSSTVAFADGGFKCQRGSCGHVTGQFVRDHLRTHHAAAAALLPARYETVGVRRLREMLSPVEEVTDLDTIGLRVRAAIETHQPGTLTVVAVPPGVGKSHAAVEAAVDRDARVTLSMPTHALAQELRTKAEALDPGCTTLHRSPLRAVDPLTSRPLCIHYDRAKAWQMNGGSIHRFFCATCEKYNGCRARDSEAFGHVNVTVHALSVHAPGGLVIFDESPDLFREVTLTRADVDRAYELLMPIGRRSVLTPTYQVLMKPWLHVVREAWGSRDLARGAECLLATHGAILIAVGFGAYAVHRRNRPAHGADASEQPSGDALRDAMRLAVLAGDVALRSAGSAPALADASWAENLDALRVFGALSGVARTPRWRTVDGETVLAGQTLTAAAIELRDHGGIVLDATPPLEALRAVNARGSTLVLGAADGAPVKHAVYYAADAFRSKFRPPDPGRSRRNVWSDGLT